MKRRQPTEQEKIIEKLLNKKAYNICAKENYEKLKIAHDKAKDYVKRNT